jgi:hypothetical protein
MGDREVFLHSTVLISFSPGVVGQDPPTGIDRQHESREAWSLYPLALQITCILRLRSVGRAT